MRVVRRRPFNSRPAAGGKPIASPRIEKPPAEGSRRFDATVTDYIEADEDGNSE